MRLNMNVIKKQITCEIHDINYTAEIVKFGRTEKIEPCPNCKEKTKLDNEVKEREKTDRIRNEFFIKNLKSSRIPKRYSDRTLDNFRCEISDQYAAIEKARQFSNKLNTAPNSGVGLILSGKQGTGKTHIACSIGREYARVGTVLFLTTSELIRKIRETYRNDCSMTEQGVIDLMANYGLLILDEIGMQKGTESEENLLFEVINKRYSNLKSTILISNLNTVQMQELIGVRTIDRMKEGGGMLINFKWDSYRTKISFDDKR